MATETIVNTLSPDSTRSQTGWNGSRSSYSTSFTVTDTSIHIVGLDISCKYTGSGSANFIAEIYVDDALTITQNFSVINRDKRYNHITIDLTATENQLIRITVKTGTNSSSHLYFGDDPDNFLPYARLTTTKSIDMRIYTSVTTPDNSNFIPFTKQTKVIFNGYDLTLNGMFNVKIDEKLTPNIFATAKNINTAKAMYGRRNITTGYNREVLEFELTFCSLGKPFTESLCSELYQILDVITYKKLIFGDPTEQGASEIYFNAIPMVKSKSDMYNFGNNAGYFTIPFVCDAGHGWIDREYTFERIVGQNSATPWVIDNPSNVKDHDGYCRVYPYITINLPEFDPESVLTNYHIGFGLSTEPQEDWFRLGNISQNQTLIIDNENKQMYSSAGDNLLEAMGPNKRFFYLEKGSNIVLHETFVGNEAISSSYAITFNLACPYMW